MSDSPIKRPWPAGEEEVETTSKSYALSGKIMLASIIILFVVVVFLVLLHLYARWYLVRLHRRNETRRRNRRNRSSRIVFFVDTNRVSDSSSPTGGLDASVLKSLPLFVYSSETDGNLPECAVCLSEFENGETGRVLPKCKHSFHTECIDMWFHSNSTCPLCRSPVELVETEMSQMTILVDQPDCAPGPGSSSIISSPVQQNGELTETTSLADRRKGIDVRIDVPSWNELVTENEFRLPSPSQGFRSPGSRLQSLKRILTMSRKSPALSPSSGVGPSCVPLVTESDLELARQESATESTRTGNANLR